MKEKLSGILLSVSITLIALLLSYFPSSVNIILAGMLLGILFGNLIKIPASFNAGISFTSSKILEFSILFLAFSINYSNIAKVGWGSFLLLATVIMIVLMLTVYLSKKFQCPGSTGWLIGFGTAICGSSAIAALAPSVSKDKNDVVIAMAVVNLFGSIGMIAMPFIFQSLSLPDEQIGFMLGGTLHSVGNVAGAE